MVWNTSHSFEELVMKQRSWAHWIFLCACSCLLASEVSADGGMRCGSRLVFEGDSLYDVRSRCGVPDASSQHVEYRTLRRLANGPCFKQQGQLICGHVEEHTVEIVIDEWTYDFGSSSFIRTLTFEQGKLREVELGRYGTKSP